MAEDEVDVTMVTNRTLENAQPASRLMSRAASGEGHRNETSGSSYQATSEITYYPT